YLTSDGLVKKRCYVGAFFGRICRLLRLDRFDFIRKIFDVDPTKAYQNIKNTMGLVRDDNRSQLDVSQRNDLIRRTAKAFNDLVTHVYKKRNQNRDIPQTSLIDAEDVIRNAN